MPTPYIHTKLSDLITRLSNRLADPNFLYWSQAEMRAMIIQSLRMWQAATTFWRERAQFPTTQTGGVWDCFYNLHSVIPNSRMGFSITDQALIAEIQSHLLEPSTGNSWTGSSQWDLDTVTKALQRSRNQFLFDTGMVQTYSLLDPLSSPSGRVIFQDSVIDIRRLAWVDLNGVYYPLFRDDDFSSLSFNPGWPQKPSIPQVYSAAITPPITIELIPPPIDKGRIEAITVQSGADLNPSVWNGVLMGVPDDFAWAVKYKALSILLNLDGLTRDPSRSQYCNSLYQLGVQAAKTNPSVLMVRLNDDLLYTGSVHEMDTFMAGWQKSPGSPPTFSAMAGRNLLALGPRPDQEYGVSVDFVPNIPIPPTDADYVQVGREHLDVILGMAQHSCAFKEGGQEFADTIPFQQEFLRLAAVENKKLAANAFYRSLMEENAFRQEKEVPTMRES